jgi:mannose/fructose/N-acetylgalactosamine-specific phosphotransferase system component IID
VEGLITVDQGCCASGQRKLDPVMAILMKRSTLFSIFVRSLTIQVSFNFRRMQNLGFAFAMFPLIAEQRKDRKESEVFLARHLQMFNTHPYLVSSVIGSVARIEEEACTLESTEDLKKVLMGPYAAIGDSFFWGALRSFSCVGAVILALAGTLLAPLAFLLLYTPAYLWVRVKGFLEGYRCGRNGIDFIRSLDLPKESVKIRYLALILIGLLGAVTVDTTCRSWNFPSEMPGWAVGSVLLLLVSTGVRRGISSVKILYGMSLLCMVLSIKIW